MNMRQKLVRGWDMHHSEVEAGELQCECSSGYTTGKLLGEKRRKETKHFYLFIYLESQYLKFTASHGCQSIQQDLSFSHALNWNPSETTEWRVHTEQRFPVAGSSFLTLGQPHKLVLEWNTTKTFILNEIVTASKFSKHGWESPNNKAIWSRVLG